MLWVPNTTSTHGAFCSTASRSFWARQPPTAICMFGIGLLTRRQVAEVAVQLVVGVLADRARVEHHDVGVGAVGGPPVSGGLQQPGQPFGVVHIHLAAVGADL